MKKLSLIIVIVFGLTFGASAQGGLFKYGMVSDEEYYGSFRGANNPLMPANHSYDTDVNGQTGDPVPVGSGIAVLMGLGAAYLVAKRRKEE